jgi:capsular polysaccharide biosynthesis protein
VRTTGRPVSLRCRITERLEQFSHGKVLDLGQRLIYDARWLPTDNVAHVLQHHVSALGLVADKIGLRPADCLIVLEKNAPALGRNIFRMLGFDTLLTHRPVRASLVTVTLPVMFEPYRLLPFASVLAPAGIKSATTTKVYIPRRQSRRITNQDDIDRIAADAGFEKVYFEDLTLEDQFSLMRSSATVLGIHGAALGHLCMRSPSVGSPPLRLVEILSPGLVVDIYRKAVAALHGQWRGICGTIDSRFVQAVEESKNPKSAAFRDFHLDPEALRACLSEEINLRA